MASKIFLEVCECKIVKGHLLTDSLILKGTRYVKTVQQDFVLMV